MIEFKIIKKSKRSWARVGVLKTPHGEIETPAFVPVATQAVIKTLTSEEVVETKSQILICNTFHLHLKPGEKYIKAAGGLHKFMNWSQSSSARPQSSSARPKPLMTDSAGFQVFSLGFGTDLGVGKLLKYFPGRNKKLVTENSQPQEVKITDNGVWFRSPVDGRKIFIGPKESIKIQEALGADIIFAFDECTPPLSSRAYIEKSLDRTHSWAKTCMLTRCTDQALFGITQGSKYKDLRVKSAKYVDSLGFDGYGIGGDLGESKESTQKILEWTIPHLNKNKPRHLLGIGHPEDMEMVIKKGIDLFDCIAPTHYARRGVAFTSAGRLDLRKRKFLSDKNPIDKNCACMVCLNYRRNYISHLLRAEEITPLRLMTFHNLFYFNTLVEKIRAKIKSDKL